MKGVIREAAGADLERIHNWIAQDNPANARSAAERILSAIESKIPAFPHIARVLGKDVRVERVSHILAGAGRCAYRVTPI